MDQRKKILLAIGIVAGLIVTASATFLMLKAIRPNMQKTNPQNTTQQDSTPAEQRAESLENEATKLMDSDPAAAQQKYLEAEKAYTDASNPLKAAEMSRNATTAEASIPSPVPEDEPPIPQSGG